MFTGDIVEYRSACYCGDAHFGDWPATLEAIRGMAPDAIVPGRGAALVGAGKVAEALDGTADFVASTFRPVARVARGGGSAEAGVAGLPQPSATRNFPTSPSTSTACPSTSRAPMTRRWASTRRASGRRSATAACGKRCRDSRHGPDHPPSPHGREQPLVKRPPLPGRAGAAARRVRRPSGRASSRPSRKH